MSGALGSSGNETTSQAYPAIDPFEQERRFLLTRAQVVSFYSAIRSRATLELYDRERPISYTRTTYLDTDDFKYFQSCEGPVARRLRVRQYAVAASLSEAPALSGTCFLELKQNVGRARSKIRLAAPSNVVTQILRQQTDFDPAAAGIDEIAALRAIQGELAIGGSAAPRLTTWYRRSCMTAEGGRVRITLDEGLTFCRPQPLGAAGEVVRPAEVVAHGPSRVLEIKHWGETPDWLAPATEGLTDAPNFSKFRMGMMAMQQRGETPNLPPQRTLTPTPTLFLLSGDAP